MTFPSRETDLECDLTALGLLNEEAVNSGGFRCRTSLLPTAFDQTTAEKRVSWDFTYAIKGLRLQTTRRTQLIVEF